MTAFATSLLMPRRGDPSELGDNVRRLRKARGLTQAEFGKLVGVHRVTVIRIEKHQEAADMETIQRMIEVLGCTYEDLLGPAGYAPLVKALRDLQRDRKLMAELEGTVHEAERALLLGFPEAYWQAHPPDKASIHKMILVMRTASPQR